MKTIALLFLATVLATTAQAACIEGDGGFAPYQQASYAFANNTIHYDTCLNSTTLQEWACVNGTPTAYIVECAKSCRSVTYYKITHGNYVASFEGDRLGYCTGTAGGDRPNEPARAAIHGGGSGGGGGGRHEVPEFSTIAAITTAAVSIAAYSFIRRGGQQ